MASVSMLARIRLMAVPDTLVNVVEPPTFEILEQMIVMIEQRYKGN